MHLKGTLVKKEEKKNKECSETEDFKIRKQNISQSSRVFVKFLIFCFLIFKGIIDTQNIQIERVNRNDLFWKTSNREECRYN